MIKTEAGRLLYKIFTSHFIARVRKGLLKVCVWEGAGDQTETAIFWPPNLWPSTLCLSRSPDAQPEALGSTLLGAGFLYCIFSASSLDPNSSGLPEGLLDRILLSLPQLVYSVSNCHWNSNSTVTQLNCHQLSWLPSWLSYIIVQHLLDHPLDLWNRMFNRHQAEITVMQFTGHSLPVHPSMSVPWEFFSSSHFISQFQPTRFSLITAIRMCHFLPVHHLEWHFKPGRRSKYYRTRKRKRRGKPIFTDSKQFKCCRFIFLLAFFLSSDLFFFFAVFLSISPFGCHYTWKIYENIIKTAEKSRLRSLKRT